MDGPANMVRAKREEVSMKRTAKWQKALTVKELRHIRESTPTFSLAAFKRLREKQAVLKAAGEARIGHEHPGITEPCWDCRLIESKLRDAGVLA
jgi:hypothetical protein